MSNLTDEWDIEMRPHGWLRLRERSGEGPTVYLCYGVVGEEGHERLDLRSVVMRSGTDEPLSGRVWRRIPLAQLEEWLTWVLIRLPSALPETHSAVTAQRNRDLFAHGAPDVPSPSLDVLDDYFEATDAYRMITFSPVPSGMVVTESGRVPKLAAPEGRMTDDFLKDVADAYRWATNAQKAPAPALAELAGVPVRTVHRWVYEARKRGILPPARTGRAG
ncbi:hypothetical protein [Streptomyces achromogenes]|uniref:hypothetical protein n=1 Tax=Streptomyces achromogenes TaxID=67255 RepID=UPI0012FF4D54|nr:hypothetical protein [Streptomyces achromogenes]